MPGTTWTAGEIKILQENYSWNPAVLSMLPGRSYLATSYKAQSLGLKVDSRGDTCTLRADYFDHWTPNMAWVLGFATADGNVTAVDEPGRKSWRVTFVQKEDGILKSICDELGVPHTNIRTAIRRVKLPQGTTGTYTTSFLAFTNKHIVQRLMELGIMPNKSLQITKVAVPKKYFIHFLRGYFDGDGCFSWSTKPRQRTPRVSFTGGSPQFLKWVEARISEYYQMPGGRLVSKPQGGWTLKYNKSTSLKIMGLMYMDADATMFLPRKRESFLSYLTYHGIDLSAHETPEARLDYFYNLVKI